MGSNLGKRERMKLLVTGPNLGKRERMKLLVTGLIAYEEEEREEM